LVQLKDKVGDQADWPGVDKRLVSKGSGIELAIGREFSVIDMGNGLKVQAHCDRDCNEHEHGHSVEHESPPDASPMVIGGVEQRAHTLEE